VDNRDIYNIHALSQSFKLRLILTSTRTFNQRLQFVVISITQNLISYSEFIIKFRYDLNSLSYDGAQVRDVRNEILIFKFNFFPNVVMVRRLGPGPSVEFAPVKLSADRRGGSSEFSSSTLTERELTRLEAPALAALCGVVDWPAFSNRMSSSTASTAC
jgi:hypothetical protein